MTRRHWIGLCGFPPVGWALAQAGCVRSAQPALAKAVDWLWRQQGPDGGWHSRTYGLLRSGQSLTPFVVGALLEVPGVSNPAGLERAAGFLRAHMRGDGALGLSEDIPDFPNYATALAVSALCRLRPTGWEELVQRMGSWLRGQQFTAQNGWRTVDDAYGAWGMGGERRTPPETGHVDLSMTRHVLEALRAAGASATDPAISCARTFVERCQNPDGGFRFTTTEFDTNKAGHDGTRFRSYGTATADGILALLAVGAEPTGARVLAASRWLAEHHSGFAASGFVGEAYQRWPRGLAFYYAAASTRAFRALGKPVGADLVETLKRTQRPDGSWANPENLVKEDDPLIATSFAIRTSI